ncbi:MAG: TrmH family RNA methyltransferase [Bacteroidota bacterium]
MRRHPITLVCPDWEDPRNVGSAFRLADAAGLTELILAGTTPRPPNRRIQKTARSTVRHVPYREVEDAAAYLEEARSAGRFILALEITDESYSLLEYQPPAEANDIVLVAGAEAGGIPPELLALCDASVHLPMFGQNTSMNVAVAVGAAIYQLLTRFV